jgi:hypothetical protein
MPEGLRIQLVQAGQKSANLLAHRVHAAVKNVKHVKVHFAKALREHATQIPEQTRHHQIAAILSEQNRQQPSNKYNSYLVEYEF